MVWQRQAYPYMVIIAIYQNDVQSGDKNTDY